MLVVEVDVLVVLVLVLVLVVFVVLELELELELLLVVVVVVVVLLVLVLVVVLESWLKPVMPLKPVMGPSLPPETLSEDQSQVPVHAPEPQFTATFSAPLLTVSEVVAPTKFTPESLTPVPGVPSVSG